MLLFLRIVSRVKMVPFDEMSEEDLNFQLFLGREKARRSVNVQKQRKKEWKTTNEVKGIPIIKTKALPKNEKILERKQMTSQQRNSFFLNESGCNQRGLNGGHVSGEAV